jgi:hypothetical protein
MEIVHADEQNFVSVPIGQAPAYDTQNPILRLVRHVEEAELAAEREHYLADTLQYLVPFEELGLYSPGDGPDLADPRQQDNKNDFQKQNIARISFGDMSFVRGYASAGDWTGSFLKLCYADGPYTTLWKEGGGSPGDSLRLFLRIGQAQTTELLTVPYNPLTQRYDVELWSFEGGGSIRPHLGAKGQAAFDAGLIQVRPDLVKGNLAAFTGPGFDEEREAALRSGGALGLFQRWPEHTMHPIRPLRLELAWANQSATTWDSRGGQNHHYEFGMQLRGWNAYFQIGQSKNPHGGIGFLEFRNLFSNYFGHETQRRAALGTDWSPELGRRLEPWNFDAHTWRPTEPSGPKAGAAKREDFLAVEYMDLHILQPDCGIGIHRHRDNQEVFFLLQGKGLMIVGDWLKHPRRQRAFEIRTKLPGDLTICKTGQLHALYNALDEPASLFMFGGYD